MKEMREISTDRFNDSEAIPRSVSPGALIDLILPFAEESKSMANSEGYMPWQLARNKAIAAQLFSPPAPENEEFTEFKLSQVQGQIFPTQQEELGRNRI